MNMKSRNRKIRLGIAAAVLALALQAGGCQGAESAGPENTGSTALRQEQGKEQGEKIWQSQEKITEAKESDQQEPEQAEESGRQEPGQAEDDSQQEPEQTEDDSPQEPGQAEDDSPQEPEQTEESGRQEPGQAEENSQQEPGQAEDDSQSEPEGDAEKIDRQARAFAEEKLASMTLEEKIAQMFFITPDALTGVQATVQAGEITKSSFSRYPVGGLVFFESNIQSPQQIIQMNQRLTEISRERVGVIPFLGVDEEGGTVLRIADNPQFAQEDVGNMSEIGSAGDPEIAYETGRTLGAYLSEYGFNVDFAPVADLWNNPENQVVKYRSFGSDSVLVSEMVARETIGLQEYGISAALKHFPGHGSTAGDSHKGAAVSLRTEEELAAEEYQVFQAGIEAGAEFVLAGHISFPNIESQDIPATLSYHFLTEVLRDQLGFQGIVITDAMNMAAIANFYTSADAAVAAVKAGVDMILMPVDFENAYRGLLQAVQSGEISENRINDSVKRILVVKYKKMSE